MWVDNEKKDFSNWLNNTVTNKNNYTLDDNIETYNILMWHRKSPKLEEKKDWYWSEQEIELLKTLEQYRNS